MAYIRILALGGRLGGDSNHVTERKGMSELLERINGPADLKELSTTQLKALAGEVRQLILDSVSKTGGHLASNLGVVELTLALHRAFDFQHDALLWDVGHQSYAHKIITGRKDQFVRLRQAGGLSGFPNPAESPYDRFAVGHAGTSIPTAIGMALGEQVKRAARRQAPEGADEATKEADEEQRKVVAVVGDASIVNGVSFEGLNNLGLVKRQLLIILNDNSMAIDATVGAMAKYFSKIRLSHTYEDLRKTTSSILEHMPVIGRSMDEALERFKKSIRMVLTASQMFESMNIPYFGPVDGHDIESLIQLFEALRHLEHPAILHIHTQKGKGFEPADAKPSKYHSTGPFKINGNCVEPRPASDKRTYTSVFGEHLTQLAEEDERIVAITSAMCDGTGLMEFRKRFVDRFYDVGIAESAAVDIAAGLAKTGLRPVVCIYSTFLQRAFDQVFQEVALQDLPVVFCVDRAGFVGSDGPTHHGLMDVGYMRMMPNMVVTAPSNDLEMRLALEFAFASDKPVVIRYPKDGVPPEDYVRAACKSPFVLGRSLQVRKTKEAAIHIVGFGCMLAEALKAAEMMAQRGISADVYNGRFAAPVDEKITGLCNGQAPVIIAEDHGGACGFGSAVLEAAVATGRSLTAVRILGAPRRFMSHDTRAQQLTDAKVNADSIVATAEEMLDNRP